MSPAIWTASRLPPKRWRTSTRTATRRWRSSAPASGTSATAAGTRAASELLERGRRAAWVPEHMRHRYQNWVARPQRRLADQPAAVLRGAVPGLVPARRRRRAGLRPPAAARRGRPAGRPVVDCPTGYDRVPARPAGRVHRRPGRDGHLGHLLADAADRRRLGARRGPVRAGLPDGPAPAGARDHPDLAVRPGGAGALRERHAALGTRR